MDERSGLRASCEPQFARREPVTEPEIRGALGRSLVLMTIGDVQVSVTTTYGTGPRLAGVPLTVAGNNCYLCRARRSHAGDHFVAEASRRGAGPGDVIRCEPSPKHPTQNTRNAVECTERSRKIVKRCIGERWHGCSERAQQFSGVLITGGSMRAPPGFELPSCEWRGGKGSTYRGG